MSRDKNTLELASGGIETTRAPVTVQEQRRRAATRVEARQVIESWASPAGWTAGVVPLREGRCPVCHQLAPLTAVGRIDRHPARVVGQGGKPRQDRSLRCGGFTHHPQEIK